jgi:hypothetical protein
MNMHKLAVTISAAAMTTFGAATWAADLSVPNSFSSGTTISSSQMNANFSAVQTKVNAIMANTEGSALKTLVDGHTTSITTLNTTVGGHTTSINTLTTDVNNLKNGTPACGTGMASVGPTCIDTARQGPSISWKDAVAACRTANKRLPTAGELVGAHLSGAITNLADNTAEHVDGLGNSGTGEHMYTAYVGNNLSGLGSPGAGILQSRTDALYDTNYAFIYFRCAR